MTTVAELLEGHVTLEVECVDRLYLNGYMPELVTGAGLTHFLLEHLGKPIPSPAVLGQITTRFREAVRGFADAEGLPWVEFRRGDRKDEVASRLRQERGVRGGVVFIGVAQEKTTAFEADLSRGPWKLVRRHLLMAGDHVTTFTLPRSRIRARC